MSLRALLLSLSLSLVCPSAVHAAAPIAKGASSDLRLTKTLDLDTDTKATAGLSPAVRPTGATVVYNLLVENLGPNPASGVTVFDTLPTGLVFVSAAATQGACTGTTSVTCDLGSVTNGGNAWITLVARIVATSGLIENSANVISQSQDGNASNNVSFAQQIQVLGAAPAAAVAVPTSSSGALRVLVGLIGLAGFVALSRRLAARR